jgi:8-hydroxy-5-deazaflavin:NADPH oxidoreductase
MLAGQLETIPMNRKRRIFLATTAVMLLAGVGRAFGQERGRSMKIGVIGSGRIGGTLGEFWVKAGHEVVFSARTIEEVNALVARLNLGPRARAGTPREAAEFGEVVLISVPYAALPQIGRDLAAELKGKVVLDTGNPYPQRDGAMAVDARARGTGVTSAEFLPGVRLVRAFNSVGDWHLRNQAGRPGDRVAVPLAADDEAAMMIAAKLVEDAGFEPVPVGPLSRAREFDFGTPVYGLALTARDLRYKLGIRR